MKQIYAESIKDIFNNELCLTSSRTFEADLSLSIFVKEKPNISKFQIVLAASVYNSASDRGCRTRDLSFRNRTSHCKAHMYVKEKFTYTPNNENVRENSKRDVRKSSACN